MHQILGWNSACLIYHWSYGNAYRCQLWLASQLAACCTSAWLTGNPLSSVRHGRKQKKSRGRGRGARWVSETQRSIRIVSLLTPAAVVWDKDFIKTRLHIKHRKAPRNSLTYFHLLWAKSYCHCFFCSISLRWTFSSGLHDLWQDVHKRVRSFMLQLNGTHLWAT